MVVIMFLLVIEWSIYIWPNGWNGSWCVEASMVLSDSQLSLRPLCTKLLITHIDYTLAICLTKCLSRLLGIQSRSWKSIIFSTIISMLFYWYKEMVQFWVVTWALGLKSGSNPRVVVITLTILVSSGWRESLWEWLWVVARTHAYSMGANEP